jgi:multiple sugar transport system substrate-binding protein
MSYRLPPSLNRRHLLSQGLACALGTGLGLHSGRVAARRRQRLTVAAFPAVDEIVRAAVPAWQRLHPEVEIHVVSRQFADHHTAMTTALSTSVYLPDVMALEVGYVGRFAQGGGLTDLTRPPYDIGRLRSRYVPYAYDQATARNGAVVAAPTDIGPGTLLYRHDVLGRAGVTPEALTATWTGYVEAGRRLKAGTGAYLLAHARDLKDILIRVGVAPGEGLYFDSASKVLVNTPRFVRAFELAREARRDKLDARVAAWSNEWSEGFKRGTLATQPTGAWLAGHLNNWLAPDTRGLWRAAHLPEGAFVAFGGTFLALPRDADAAMKPLAWELVRLLTLDRGLQLQAFKQQDAFPATVDALDDPFFEQDIAFLGGQPARRLWRSAAQRITAVQVHKQDAFASEVIDTELDKVLDRGKDIATALGDAERLLARRAFR